MSTANPALATVEASFLFQVNGAPAPTLEAAMDLATPLVPDRVDAQKLAQSGKLPRRLFVVPMREIGATDGATVARIAVGADVLADGGGAAVFVGNEPPTPFLAATVMDSRGRDLVRFATPATLFQVLQEVNKALNAKA